MRTRHLKIVATGLLVAGAWIVVRQWEAKPPGYEDQVGRGGAHGDARSSQDDRLSAIPENARKRVRNRSEDRQAAVPVKQKRAQNCQHLLIPGSMASPRSTSHFPSPATLASATLSRTWGPVVDSTTSAPRRIVQLAGDVQLPAAIMAQADVAMDASLPPVVAAANREIIDNFYRELSDPEAQAVEPSMVTQGPVTDEARNRANQAYRALFGDEAYNRQVMNSALERLMKNE